MVGVGLVVVGIIIITMAFFPSPWGVSSCRLKVTVEPLRVVPPFLVLSPLFAPRIDGWIAVTVAPWTGIMYEYTFGVRVFFWQIEL